MIKAFLPFNVKESLEIIKALRKKVELKCADGSDTFIRFDKKELYALLYIIYFFKKHYIIDNKEEIENGNYKVV